MPQTLSGYHLRVLRAIAASGREWVPIDPHRFLTLVALDNQGLLEMRHDRRHRDCAVRVTDTGRAALTVYTAALSKPWRRNRAEL